MTATTPVLELEGVTKRYAAGRAVDGVHLVVPPRSITAILGQSGAGKSTLVRMIAGLTAPTTGTIWLSGEAVAGERASRLIPPERRSIGVAFQRPALFPHLDLASNIGYGVSRRQRHQRVAELLEMIGLGGQGRRMPRELSPGQAQCVAVARAIAPRPAVLVLDEPFAPVESSRRADVRSLVTSIIQREHLGALLFTQASDDALAVGDQVGVLVDGRLIQVGEAEEVYRNPVSPGVAALLGDANVVEGTVAKGVLRTALGPFRVEAEDGEVRAVVRPEDLDLEISAGGTAQVTHVDYFGHDQVVTVTLRDGLIVRARVHAWRRLAVGARVRVKPKGHPPVVFPR